jgi:phosphoglucomutase
MANIGQLDPAIFGKINLWLNGDYDQDSKDEIQALLEANDITELTDRFYKELEFGTGGLRGIMGAGSNRVNKYTIGAATQGFANFLNKKYTNPSVVIAHDNRNNSSSLAKVVVDVFSANNIKVYHFKGLRPTPQLSFTIRNLACQGGVMLTASHNPKEYNGYKAYGEDGGQLVSPFDRMVLEEVYEVDNISKIKFQANPQFIFELDDTADHAYIDALLKQKIAKEAVSRQSDLCIVFSPIHGTGSVMVPPTLKAWGFRNVHLVESQMMVDGNFPTVIYPNPEEEEAMSLSTQKAKSVHADIVMATDPDADRVGTAIPNTKGEYILLNGNQAVSLLIYYLLEMWSKSDKLNGKQYVVKTIVTSNLIDQIAKAYGVECYNVLTGFKYVGELMTKLEGEKIYIAGGEESYGYLIGDHARDKDAVVSCAMIAEMTAYYKDQGTSLYEVMLDMYQKYGYYREKLISITKKGKSGAEEIKEMMNRFRSNPPVMLGGSKIAMLKDYLTSTCMLLDTNTVEIIQLPKSDVLQFVTEDGSVISARPSGTEPKIKFYCSLKGELTSREDFEKVTTRLDDRLNAIMRDLGVA